MIRSSDDLPSPPGVAIRPATIADAPALARHVNMAGEGLPLSLWAALAQPGEDPWEVGRRRAERNTGGFSWRNARVLEQDGEAVGSLIGYPLDPEPADEAGVPPVIVPMLRLEALAGGSWYVNVLAVDPHARGRGHGARLLRAAEAEAAAVGRTSVSLIVADNNAVALRLYERSGFRIVADAPVVRDGWDTSASRWILMIAG
jgi:ribosomal protein S18 acetylase RimI-like enzyme